ncbi:hypothetical protein [Paenibacillus sp. FSL H3-0457]|uniref:hypothetical protein n=1 Tax=Paenibacillus sp. FSL H3-0457 TaxID=2921430 RepID=UPI0030EF49A5
MAEIAKLLYQGVIPTTATSIYTAPPGKYTVIKSIFLTSLANGTDRTFNLVIGGITVGYGHTVKSFKTLFFDDIGIFLLPGETIQLHCSGGNVISQISGIESDYVPAEFPYIKSNGSIPAVTSSTILNPDSSHDWIIKSLIITNHNSADREIVVQSAGFSLLYRFNLKAYDTLIVPLPNFMLPKGQTVTAYTMSGGALFGIVAERVVQ